MIQVVLVDDHHVVRRGIESFLSAMPDIQVIGSAESGEQLLERLEQWLPDVIVMGGGVSHLPDVHAATNRKLIEMMAGYAVQPEHREGFVVPPGLDDDAGIVGALALAESAA